MKWDHMFGNLLLLAVTLTAAASEPAAPATSQAVKARIEQLRKLLIPPAGTQRTEVDAVYGQPREIAKLPPNGKGSSADYPLHEYTLLPPRGTEPFRAFLYVTYRQGKVWRAGINHLAVMKGRPDLDPGSPEAQQQEQDIARENSAVLIDLEEIHTNFAAQLKAASWNSNPNAEAAPARRWIPLSEITGDSDLSNTSALLAVINGVTVLNFDTDRPLHQVRLMIDGKVVDTTEAPSNAHRLMLAAIPWGTNIAVHLQVGETGWHMEGPYLDIPRADVQTYRSYGPGKELVLTNWTEVFGIRQVLTNKVVYNLSVQAR